MKYWYPQCQDWVWYFPWILRQTPPKWDQYPQQVIALFVRIPSSVSSKLENFVVKEDHVLKLELKQVVKKLKEDPRNVLVWEEQDQADQKKISEQTKNILSM